MTGLVWMCICMTFFLGACGRKEDSSGNHRSEDNSVSGEDSENGRKAGNEFIPAGRETKVRDVINQPVFEGYGRLLFPVDRTISDGLTLEDVGDILIWYNNINPDRTVEIVNCLGEQAAEGWIDNAVAFWERQME